MNKFIPFPFKDPSTFQDLIKYLLLIVLGDQWFLVFYPSSTVAPSVHFISSSLFLYLMAAKSISIVQEENLIYSMSPYLHDYLAGLFTCLSGRILEYSRVGTLHPSPCVTSTEFDNSTYIFVNV